MRRTIVYGKAGCPHTARALAAHPDAEYRDVLQDPAAQEELLRLSGGVRRVPVIVGTDGRADPVVGVGFERGS